MRIGVVIAALDAQFAHELDRVPSLKVLVRAALAGRRNVAEAVSKYQLGHGYDRTQLALRVLFCPGRLRG